MRESSFEARKVAVDNAQANVLEWYLQEGGGILPLQQCVYTHPITGVTCWWLEPKLLGKEDPTVVESTIAGQWHVRIELNPKIRSTGK